MSPPVAKGPHDAIPEWVTVGSRATWAREQAGLTVRQAAEAAHLSMGEVDTVEMDAVPAEYQLGARLRDLAPLYGVSLDWLRYGVVADTARSAALNAIGMMTRAGMPPKDQRSVVLLLLCQAAVDASVPMTGHRAIQAHKGGSP